MAGGIRRHRTPAHHPAARTPLPPAPARIPEFVAPCPQRCNMGKRVSGCLLADSIRNDAVCSDGLGGGRFADLTCIAEKVSTSDSEKPSGSLTLRNADAALGVMYVLFFLKVGGGGAAVSENRTGKRR